MKLRESGMPEEVYWESLFNVPLILDRVGIDPALASGAFVTTVTDVVGFFAFLGLAALVLI